MPNEVKLEVPEAMIPVIKSALVAAADEDAKLAKFREVAKAELSDDEQNKVRMALRLLAGLKDKLPAGALKALADAAGYGYPEPGMSKSEHEAATKIAVDAAVAKALAEAKLPERKLFKTADGTEIDLATIPEAQRPAFEALAKSADVAQKKLDAEVAERKRRDLVEKSRTDFPNLDATKIADVLVKSESLGAEHTKSIVEVLKQAEALLAEARPFEERGSGAGGGTSGAGTAWAKIEAAGASLVAKSDGKLTSQKAIDSFLRTAEGRALYKQHLAERRAQ